MSFNYIPAGPSGVDKNVRDRARDKAEPLTPRDERRSLMHGPLEMSLQTSKGLCTITSKCVWKDGHAVPCWPGD